MADFWIQLELLPISAHIGETWWFPLLESLHVLTAMFVVGSIVFVDLRLLGLSAMRYPARRFVDELVRWTWASFAIAVLTGLGMFLTRASWYVSNPAFQAKLLVLALAGANMAIFRRFGGRNMERWDTASATSTTARIAGAASILCWMAVTLAGRWTGHLS
jgi:hypothetical protein